ncbi:hypothetical protein BBJ28_00003492 [Nothophytophthora sp. Chile5]|nr:hypothetical protein BBJ28_00003492 [Nothophytophthora sp. Chile5]
MRSMPPGDEDFILDESSVLAFLADCDMADDSTATPTVSTEASAQSTSDAIATWSDSASASSASTPESKPQQKKSWRQRRKEEVLHLREVVKQLSAKLDQLKLAAGVRSTLPDSEFAGVTTAPTFVLKAQAAHKTETAAMWEKIAGRQRKLCNAHLKDDYVKRYALLEDGRFQSDVANSQLQAMTTSFDVCKLYRFHGSGVIPPTDNDTVFDDLMAGMDEMYADLDGFFERRKMHELSCPGRRNNTANGRTRGVFVDFLDCHAVPFDLRRTESVIWTPPDRPTEDPNNIFLEVRPSIDFPLSHFTAGSNTQMKSMCVGFTLANIDVRIKMRTVTRKYVESDRTVFISRTLIEPTPVAHDFVRVSFTETSRLILTHGASSALGSTTVMHTHREATVHDGLGVESSDWQTLSYLNLGVDAWENSIAQFNQAVEDAT